MINNPVDIPSTYGLVGTSLQAKSSSSTANDISSSFQEILSTMMMSSSMPSSDGQSSFGVNDMMAPLMLILLEKMISLQVEQETNTDTAKTESTNTPSIDVSKNVTPSPKGRPVAGVLTQEFHPGHNGLDFGIVVGTPIKTTMDGKVTYAGWNNQGYGNLVIVENGAYKTYYAHLSSIPVAVGDAVNAGTVIGLSGNTGNSTGPHLHYEIRKNNVPIDPTSVTLGANA